MRSPEMKVMMTSELIILNDEDENVATRSQVSGLRKNKINFVSRVRFS